MVFNVANCDKCSVALGPSHVALVAEIDINVFCLLVVDAVRSYTSNPEIEIQTTIKFIAPD